MDIDYIQALKNFPRLNISAMSTFLHDIVFAMRTAQEKGGLTGAQKRNLVLDTLVAAGLIRSDEREVAGATIDALVWAARNRNEIKKFTKDTARTFCCLG